MAAKEGQKQLEFILPDGTKKQYPEGVRGREVVGDIGPGLAKAAVALHLDNRLLDLVTPLRQSGSLRFITDKDPEALEILRHSTAHVMAHAVLDLFPDAKVGIGPAIKDGFYYDFDKAEPFVPEDLEKIEKRMAELVKEKKEFVREKVSRDTAAEEFKKRNDEYKLELLQDLEEDQEITLYHEGGFTDLCRGPHLPDTGKIKHFKLLSIAGAYWRADADRKQLQRIYGTAFFKKEDLEKHLHWIEEARERDHRRLGQQLDLFSIQEDFGPGLPLWHPKGMIIRNIIEEFLRKELYRQDYQFVAIPHIAKVDLWEKTGHFECYHEMMYTPMDVDGQDYIVKPMNCPGHILIFKNQTRSYRDLPVRMAEFGTVYRYEPSGTLHGLMRVRGFTQDDAHVFCTPEQLTDEVAKLIEFVDFVLKTFDFEYKIYLATKPIDAIGDDAVWERSTEALKEALARQDLEYELDVEGGAFYGPKLDFKLFDAIERQWQLSTIQVDFNLPQRLDIDYVASDGEKKKVVMVHRALLGSLERFFGILIEHFKGAFPTWIAPVQARVMPVTDEINDYGREVFQQLKQAGIRVELDDRSEKIGYKIREGETQKIPYMLVVGKKEQGSGQVSLRLRGEGDKGTISIDEVVKIIREDIPGTLKKE
jgi:threonyl-tRNA synthetase